MVSDADNSSLQLVEMCSSEGVWSPVCDYDWTPQDATVVCRQLGYLFLGTRYFIAISVLCECMGLTPNYWYRKHEGVGCSRRI